MKRNSIRFVKIICLILPVLLVVLLLPFRTSDNLIRIRDFYREDEDTLDVVILGASEVFAGFSSALAYGEYGFTSYPYCLSSNYIDLFKVQLDEIYRTQSPQVVVVDISGAVRPDVPEQADAIFREYIEKVPLSGNKIRAVHTFGDREHLLSYYIPFMMYHGSEDLQSVTAMLRDEYDALKRGYGYLKGTVTCTINQLEGELIPLSQEERMQKQPLPEMAEEKLRDLLDYCREKNYHNLLFTAFPHRISNAYACHRIGLFNTAEALIKEYGYDFVHLENLSDEIGIAQNQDYYNNEHLNIYGQQKLTRYLSQILVEKYHVGKSVLSEENRMKWDKSYDYIQRYYAYAEKLMREQPGVENWIWEENWQIKAIGNTDTVSH